jgi:hypothetical protein
MVLIRFVFKIIVGALGALLGLTAVVTILLAMLESDIQPLYLMTIAIIFGVPTWICYLLYKKISAADLDASDIVPDAAPAQPTVTVRVGGREVIWELGEYSQSFIQRWIERAETIIELARQYDIQADFRDDSSFYLEFYDTTETLPNDALNLFPHEIDVSIDEYFEIVMQVEEYELNKYRPTYKYTAAISVEVFGDEQRYVDKTLINEDGEATDIRTVQSVIKKYGAAKINAREIISDYYADK